MTDFVKSPIEEVEEILQAGCNSDFLKADTSDGGNADAFVIRHGSKFRHVEKLGWLHWNGTYWEQDNHAAIKAMRDTIALRGDLLGKCGDNDKARQSKRSTYNVKAALEQAQSLLAAEIGDGGDFDQMFDFFPAKNGIIDLRTGALLPHSPEYGFTWNAPIDYVPDADYSAWEAFLAGSIYSGDEKQDTLQELEALQTWSGYSITGQVTDERILYLYGPTGSGKGTYVETMQALMPYPVSQTRGFGSFTSRRQDDTQHFDYAGLERARMIHAHESSRFVELNASTLKDLTDGSLFATYKGKQGFDFKIRFKLVLTSNWTPNIDVDDYAAWARLVLVKFPNSHRDTDDEETSLKAFFQQPAQLESVLSWSVQGAVKWYKRSRTGKVGLLIPETWKEAKRVEHDNADFVQQWMDASVEYGSQHFTPSSTAIDSYETWCKLNSVEPKRARAFATALGVKGYKVDRYFIDKVQQRGYKGFKVVNTWHHDDLEKQGFPVAQ